MANRLSGKTALITAAGAGIGNKTAELFLQEGANVIATDINSEGLVNLRDCQAHTLDVTDSSAIQELADKVGLLIFCLIVPASSRMARYWIVMRKNGISRLT